MSGDANLQPQTVDWDVEPAVVGKGWVFVSINYRLAPSSPWPAQIEDAKCAIRFLRAKAPDCTSIPPGSGSSGPVPGVSWPACWGSPEPAEAGLFEEGGDLKSRALSRPWWTSTAPPT